MQVQGTDSLIPKSSRYTGPIDCTLQTLRSEGVGGLFRGGVTTFLRESLGNVMFFSVYEYVRHFMHLQLRDASSKHKGLTDLGIGIISGGLGGVAFWSAVLPLDVAKTIIQTNPDHNCTRNPFRVLNMVYRQAGFRGCYAGLGPTIIRAFPANGAAIVTWEFAMKILGVRHEWTDWWCIFYMASELPFSIVLFRSLLAFCQWMHQEHLFEGNLQDSCRELFRLPVC